MEGMISHWEIILRLCLAALLSALIGIERQRTSWFAGLRTHMLVCVGSTLIMLVSQYGFREVLTSQLVVLDPSRVAAQVVSGIGFLGAGTILFWKNMIRGLTTAASLWTVAAVGLAVGAGLYLAAVFTTGMVFVVLAGLKPIEKIFFKKQYLKEIKFSIKSKTSLMQIDEVITQLNLKPCLTNLQIEIEDHREILHLFFKSSSNIHILKVIEELRKIPGLEKIELIE